MRDANIAERVLSIVRTAPTSVASAADGHAGSADGRLNALRAAHGLMVTEVRQNGRRVDARLASDDGDAWLVVVWFSDLSLGEVESTTVYSRPALFDGVPNGLVIVLNGPSSVGKSVLMRAFADQAATPVACIDEPFFGRLPANFVAWQETLGPHVDGLLAALAAAARRGNQFVVSAAGISQPRFEAALGDVRTVYVGLDAPLDVLVERQRTQVDKFGGLAEESVGIHGGWRYDLRIDTSVHGPESAAAILEEHVRQGRGLTP
jgi:chloramphenicol 3-O-phosphotransferase